MKRLSVWLSVSLLCFLAVGAAGVSLLWSFNEFKSVERAFDGSCMPVTGIAGPEDIQIDPRARRAYISSFDRTGDSETVSRGGVYAFSLDDPLAEDAWRDRTMGIPADFEPLGLYLYTEGIEQRLFVVNAAANTVELYAVAADGDLTHLETFAERRLTSPNDLVAVGLRAFYVTNDVASGRNTPLGRFQFLTRSGAGQVLYFDGVSWRIAADGLRFANGVNISPDGSHVYVAETAGAALRIYDRNALNGSLRQLQTVKMGAAIDNIDVDRTGVLWIGAHPRPLDLARYKRNPAAHAPSMIIKFKDVAGVISEPEPVYVDDGAEISAASVGARLNTTLLIGALLEKKFLICNLPA